MVVSILPGCYSKIRPLPLFPADLPAGVGGCRGFQLLTNGVGGVSHAYGGRSLKEVSLGDRQKHRKLVHAFSGSTFFVYNFWDRIDVLLNCTRFFRGRHFRVQLFGPDRCTSGTVHAFFASLFFVYKVARQKKEAASNGRPHLN